MAIVIKNKNIWIYVCVFALLVGFFSWQLHKGYKKLYHEFVMRRINQALPGSFLFLIDTVEQGGDFAVNDLDHYVAYAQRLIQYIPHPFDAYGLLGFCYYHQGRVLEAIESFKKAADINPTFFPSYYNLGVIYWNLGDRQASLGYFKKVLTKDLLLSKKQLMASQFVYKVILLDIPNPDMEVEKRWKKMWQISKMIVTEQKPLLEKLSLRLF